MKMLAWIGALGVAGALAAAGQVAQAGPAGPAKPASSCFFTRDIRNHTISGNSTLYLNVLGRSTYRVEMSGACFAGATSSDPLVIRNPPGSNQVCRPIDFDVGVHVGGHGGMTTRCIVKSITPMTPAEVAALPKRLRP